MKSKKSVKSAPGAAKKKTVKPAARKPVKVAVSKKTSRVKKPAARRTVAPKKASKPLAASAAHGKGSVKSFSSMHNNKNNTILAPKGLLTEAQLRRMPERDYMNEAQLTFFRHKLLEMRQEVLDREIEVKERLHEREVFADPADRATAEEEHWLDLRLRERESLLLRKIDDALRRIEAKEFGYCEKTGDPIGIPRLLARPTATVCVDVKGQDERVEAQFRDR
jgi:DnaK suppressor protein